MSAVERKKYDRRVKQLVRWGYSLRQAKAIAKYSTEKWRKASEFGRRRKREIWGDL